MRIRKVAGNLFVLLVGVVVALGMVEVLLRVFYGPMLVNQEMTEFDPVIGWHLMPGDYHVRRPETLTSHDIHINALHMRSPDASLEPPPGTRRVLLLGDSFVFGMLIDSNNLMAARAQDALNAAGGGPYEVLGAGAQGWGTAQQLLFTRRLHEEGFRADVYIVMFFLNDILDNLGLSYGDLSSQPIVPRFALDDRDSLYLAHTPEKEFREGGSLVRRKGGGFRLLLKDFVRTRAIAVLETRPGIVRFLEKLGYKATLPRPPSLVDAWYRPRVFEEGWPLTRSLLSALRDEVQRAGGELAVCLIPSPFQVYETYEVLVRQNFAGDPLAQAFLDDPLRPQRELAAFCRGAGIPFLDLELVFRDHEGGESLYSPKDHHLSKRGHRVTGEALAEFVSGGISKAPD